MKKRLFILLPLVLLIALVTYCDKSNQQKVYLTRDKSDIEYVLSLSKIF